MHFHTKCTYYTVNALLIFFLLRVDGVPSGLRVISNRNTNEDEYPFIVKLERQILLLEISKVEAQDNVYLCTCAAVSPSLTLTAGHCIDSTNPTKDLTDNLRIKCVIRYGLSGTNSADVLSTIRHPTYKDRLHNMQNDIGLLRTSVIRLNVFGKISPMDINMLGGHEITLFDFEHSNSSLKTLNRRKVSNPKRVLRASIVRSDQRNASTVPGVCVIRRCVPTPTQVCPEPAGSPMLHSSGIIGINTLSMGNILSCSTQIKNGLIDMGIITPTAPYSEWISHNIYRDTFDLIS